MAKPLTSTTFTEIASFVPGAPEPLSPEFSVIVRAVSGVRRRMRSFNESDTKMVPFFSMNRREGSMLVCTAAPVSPFSSTCPVPAMVVIIPVVKLTRRMTLAKRSVISRLRWASRASEYGRERYASVALPPSPALPNVPVPAMVVIMPVTASTRRTREFS